eukprot:GEZU01032983.1.p1 GENE.GEZU01032983.1~~GEZU01032983.1.p1  ORF type:complete len:145 (-),score=31.74 GEZU01032983.1:60-494(-)
MTRVLNRSLLFSSSIAQSLTTEGALGDNKAPPHASSTSSSTLIPLPSPLPSPAAAISGAYCACACAVPTSSSSSPSPPAAAAAAIAGERFRLENMGVHILKGKEEQLELFTVDDPLVKIDHDEILQIVAEFCKRVEQKRKTTTS